MRKLSKILAVLLTLCLLCGAVAIAVFASNPTYEEANPITRLQPSSELIENYKAFDMRKWAGTTITNSPVHHIRSGIRHKSTKSLTLSLPTDTIHTSAFIRALTPRQKQAPDTYIRRLEPTIAPP